ncbi:MAG: terpene cyclase/mutase family protein [Verrucomicrobiales bacterium]|nr:terpene cyclase/mutase family protein [Verrucomicrobiales bacterium]
MDTNSHESLQPFCEGFARRSSPHIDGNAVCGRQLPSFVLMGVHWWLSSFVDDYAWIWDLRRILPFLPAARHEDPSPWPSPGPTWRGNSRLGTVYSAASSMILAVSVLFGFCALVTLTVPAQELFTEKSDLAATEVDRMYVKGLQHLVRTQAADGRWSDGPYGGEPAVVGLAVVSMLAHGDDPNFGPYGPAIKRGLDFILKQANKQTGYIGRSMYNHGFATLALAEAYGMVDDARLASALEQAVKLIVTSQARNPLGAWRYSPEASDADTTVSGAQMVALFAARNAGIAVSEEAIQRGLKFFLRCQTPEGGFGYTDNASPNGARTAIGCLVLTLAKEKSSRQYKSALAYLQKAPAEQGYPHYYLYYAAQAFFHASPEIWQAWNRKNIKMLSATQNADGGWDGQFGRTFSTSASLLSLALNYRYLPIYER